MLICACGGRRDRHPNACIHVLDPATASLAGEGVVVQDRLTFPQAIRLVERSSLLITVDFWSKSLAQVETAPQRPAIEADLQHTQPG